MNPGGTPRRAPPERLGLPGARRTINATASPGPASVYERIWLTSNYIRLLSSFQHYPIVIPGQIIFLRHGGYRKILKTRLLQLSLNYLCGCEVDGLCRIGQ